eukprot:8108_1
MTIHSTIILLLLVTHFVKSEDTIKIKTTGATDWWYSAQLLPDGTTVDSFQIESNNVWIKCPFDGWTYGCSPSSLFILPFNVKLIKGNAEIIVPNAIQNFNIGEISDLNTNFASTTTSTTPPPTTTTTTTTTTTSTTHPPATTTTTLAPTTTTPPPTTTTPPPTTTTPPPTTTTTTATTTTTITTTTPQTVPVNNRIRSSTPP